MAKQNKILVVEDDKSISQLVCYNLDKAGFQCVSCTSGEKVFEMLAEYSIELVVLDVMLPKMDGFEVCKILKQNNELSDIPVLMLTARGEEIDRVVGFELGADDYLVKPFSVRELVLRVKAILRRGELQQSNSEIIKVGDITIDVEKYKVDVAGVQLSLTSMEFKLLVALMKKKGRVQSRDRLLEDVWGLNSEITTRTIDTHIKCLRKKIGVYGDLIETIRGLGYRFKDV